MTLVAGLGHRLHLLTGRMGELIQHRRLAAAGLAQYPLEQRMALLVALLRHTQLIL
ncbi:hypothetical protein D3C79_610870 [compost metagenome]